MQTLPRNASTKYYRNNKPNSYPYMNWVCCLGSILPATLDLEGTWEVAIVNIQYPFNWPNFNVEFVARMASVMESEGERKKQK